MNPLRRHLPGNSRGLWKRLCILLVSLPASGHLSAHHSHFAFDTTTPIRVTGTISSVLFSNPHSMIFVDVQDSAGQTVSWAIENSSTLRTTERRGFSPEVLKPGDDIDACGYAPTRRVTSTARIDEDGNALPRPAWWQDADRIITGRLLVLESGTRNNWSVYGPLDACMDLLGLE